MMSDNPYAAIAHLYDADVQHYTEDIPFYREMCERAGDPILDVMCGSGRVLLPLAEEGHTITGIDNAPEMLALAHARVATASPAVAERVTLLEADVRTAELPAEHFTLAFIAVNSFMHMERVRDQLAALSIIRHSLVRGGVVLIDLFNPDPATLAQEDNRVILEREFALDGQRVFKYVASQSSLATQISHMTYIFETLNADGQMFRTVTPMRLRWFYRYELEHLLARAGFMLISVYGSYELDSYDDRSDRLIVLATPRREE